MCMPRVDFENNIVPKCKLFSILGLCAIAIELQLYKHLNISNMIINAMIDDFIILLNSLQASCEY